MCFLVKQTKLNQKVAVYAVLLLNFIVLAQNRSTELNNKLNSAENQTSSFPMFLAMAIENATLLANLPGLESTKFGFLYLHGRSNHVQFDNEEVELKLGSLVDKQGYHYPITFHPNKIPSPQPPMYLEAHQNQSTSQNESQLQNTTDYQTLPQFAAKYQHSLQVPAENESTPRNSDLQNTFEGQNLSQPQDIPQQYHQSATTSWQSANSTYFKPSPQNSYDAFNSNTTTTQELSKPTPASPLQEHETRQEEAFLNTTTQHNNTQQAEYSQGYQQQEQPRESTTPQQTSFENSAGTIPYQDPLTPEQSFEKTMNQNTAQTNATQQQNYYSSVYQQQQQERSENTTPLQSVFENSTAEDPRFTFGQPKYMNDEPQQNLQLRQQEEQTQQNITEAQQISSLNSSETLQEQINSFRQNGDHQEQSSIQGNNEQRNLQENINDSISRDQQSQQYSFKNLTTPQPITQSAGEEKFIQESETEESSLENATNSEQPEQERSFNQTEKQSNITDEQFQKQLLFSEQGNKQNLPYENATNLKDTEQNLYQIETDPNIIQSLLSEDLSRLRNEYELTAQKVKTATTDAITPSPQVEYQETYSRPRREDKEETTKYLFKKTDVKQNVQNKEAKRVLGKQHQKLLEKNQFKTTGKNLHTSRLKRMINKARTGEQDEPHSKATIFDKLLNNPSKTNFLMLPSTEANHKHSKRSPEHDVLMKLEAMRYTYVERHNECPIFVIFGTSSESCYTLTTDKNNCAEEFIEVREVFKQGCAETQFYIYVREHEAGKVREDNVQSLTKNGINVLIPE